MMKGLVTIILACIMFVSPAAAATGGIWETKCSLCHQETGKPAPSKGTLLGKYKTADEFIKAAKAAQNPMMNVFKKDELLKSAVEQLYSEEKTGN